MRNFYPQFHTPETLADQFNEVYAKYPEAILVGSLGRAAIYNDLIADPYREFVERGQHPLKKGVSARDIDFIGVEADVVAHILPFWVDSTPYDDDSARIVKKDSQWFLTSNKKLLEQLHPRVMEPVAATTIYGIPCTTISLETHLALHKIRGAFRSKDQTSLHLLMALVQEQTGRATLPNELYGPFEKLHTLNNRAIPERS